MAGYSRWCDLRVAWKAKRTGVMTPKVTVVALTIQSWSVVCVGGRGGWWWWWRWRVPVFFLDTGISRGPRRYLRMLCIVFCVLVPLCADWAGNCDMARFRARRWMWIEL